MKNSAKPGDGLQLQTKKAQTARPSGLFEMVRPRRESSEDIFDALSDMEYQLKHSDIDLSILFEEDSE